MSKLKIDDAVRSITLETGTVVFGHTPEVIALQDTLTNMGLIVYEQVRPAPHHRRALRL